MHKDLYDLFAIVFITCYKIGTTYLTTGVLSEASGGKLEEKSTHPFWITVLFLIILSFSSLALRSSMTSGGEEG